jgi:DNA-binding NarL/FixJ family response regulator
VSRVLIVDDDARFRALARALVEDAGHHVVAEAANGQQALAAAGRVRPDAAIVDLRLPDIDGVTLARRLTGGDATLRVLLTSTDPALGAPSAVAEAGALGFVAKDRLASADLGAWFGARNA